MSDALRVILEGLPRRERRHRVIVVGAGLAGLVAAYELIRAGHQVVLIEAQERVGGRIQTLRAPFSDGLYAEAGGMRFPASHDLTMAYVRRFHLVTSPFTSGNPEAFVYIHGTRMRQKEFARDPGIVGFQIHPREQGCSPANSGSGPWHRSPNDWLPKASPPGVR